MTQCGTPFPPQLTRTFTKILQIISNTSFLKRNYTCICREHYNMHTVVLILLLGYTSMSYTEVLAPNNSIVSLVISISELPPENKQKWVHPIIFEPQERIQLTQSSYQVTTFLDFKPFLNAFKNIKGFIEGF